MGNEQTLWFDLGYKLERKEAKSWETRKSQSWTHFRRKHNQNKSGKILTK